MNKPGEKMGEVIEASSARFTAQSYRLHQAPPLGCLVRSSDGSLTIYGVVSQVVTGGIDPGRRPVARGQGAASVEEVYREHPQLQELLRTEFEALVVGHRGPPQADRGSGRTRHYLPPGPARLHDFVYQCDVEEVKEFTQELDFLTLLLSAPGSGHLGDPLPAEELVGACLRGAAQARGDDRDFLVRAGKELTRLLGGEPQRLNAVLRRIRP